MSRKDRRLTFTPQMVGVVYERHYVDGVLVQKTKKEVRCTACEEVVPIARICRSTIGTTGLKARCYNCENKRRVRQLARSKGSRNAYCAAKAAERKARKILATPDWADHEAITRVYRWSALAKASTGVDHHVDHIVPLHGRTVSGLHVHFNLQVLPYWENIEKRNKFNKSLDITTGWW